MIKDTTPTINGTYRKGVIVPERKKLAEDLIRMFGWIKVNFPSERINKAPNKRSIGEFFGLWKNNPESEKAIKSLKEEWKAWSNEI